MSFFIKKNLKSCTFTRCCVQLIKMTEKEAKIKAKEFLLRMNSENPYKEKLKWVLYNPKDIGTDWYFDSSIELKNPNENFGIGGAPGFRINKKDQTIQIVSWEEYNSTFFN